MRSVRVLVGAAGFLGAFFAPPWVPLAAIVLLALRYPAWEAIAIGLAVDLLWLAPREAEGLLGFVFSLPLFTLLALILVWGLDPVRREFLLE